MQAAELIEEAIIAAQAMEELLSALPEELKKDLVEENLSNNSYVPQSCSS